MLKYLLFFTLFTSGFSLKKISILKPKNKKDIQILLNKNILPDRNNIKDRRFNYKFKLNALLPEENYNLLMQDLLNHKVSKLYIDPNYKELVSYNSNEYYHTDINPIVIPNLVQKTSELNIPIEFKTLTPDNFAVIKNIFFAIFNFGIYGIVGILILSTISSIYQFSNFNFYK